MRRRKNGKRHHKKKSLRPKAKPAPETAPARAQESMLEYGGICHYPHDPDGTLLKPRDGSSDRALRPW